MKIIDNLRRYAVSTFFLSGLCFTINAQTAPEASPPKAKESEVYCAGFIEYAPAPYRFEIVGGEQEQERRVYSAGDYVYINAGTAQGIRNGQEFSIIRPRGQFTTKLTKKKGWLGVYTQEVGQLRVVDVKERVSVAVITKSCETILLGDLLRAAYPRPAPDLSAERTFNRFTDPSNKKRGRIILARDGQEMISTNQVVFIDLGEEDGLRVGDRLVIYRPVGTGNVTRFSDKEVVPNASGGFESERFRGGKFSNQSQRVKDGNSTGIFGPTVNTPEIKRRRPQLPRKIVGELVVTNVQRRTSTGIITQVAQEIITGDYVEVK